MVKVLLDIDVFKEAINNLNSKSYRSIERLKNVYNAEIFVSAFTIISVKNEIKSSCLEKFLKNIGIKVISVTGKEALEALNYENSFKAINELAFLRLGKDGFMLTKEKKSSNSELKEITSEEVLNGKLYLNKPENIPILNLKSEYYEIMEDVDYALLKTSAKANYILGEEVKELEKSIAKYIGIKYAVGVSSGTDALVLSLRALAIKLKGKEYWDKEDLIVTTPFTFTATGDAILRAGATPLFVDIDPLTYNLNPELIREAIKKYGNKVKGILPVHLYGHPADMTEIMNIAKEYNLFVVEDCAQSLGATWEGKQTGSFGDLGCFSFFPTKPLGGFGDGGMVTTSDEELYELVLMLRKHGGKDKYNVEHVGYNARLDTIQASVLLQKLKFLDKNNLYHRKIAENYNKQLEDIDWIKVPYEHPKAYHIYHQYTIRVSDGKRDILQKKLKEKGIQSMVYYPAPLHKMKVFINNGMEILGNLRESEKASIEVLSLPISYVDIRKIVSNV